MSLIAFPDRLDPDAPYVCPGNEKVVVGGGGTAVAKTDEVRIFVDYLGRCLFCRDPAKHASCRSSTFRGHFYESPRAHSRALASDFVLRYVAYSRVTAH